VFDEDDQDESETNLAENKIDMMFDETELEMKGDKDMKIR